MPVALIWICSLPEVCSRFLQRLCTLVCWGHPNAPVGSSSAISKWTLCQHRPKSQFQVTMFLTHEMSQMLSWSAKFTNLRFQWPFFLCLCLKTLSSKEFGSLLCHSQVSSEFLQVKTTASQGPWQQFVLLYCSVCWGDQGMGHEHHQKFVKHICHHNLIAIGFSYADV